MLSDMVLVDYLGWVATGVFLLSYFCKSAAALRSFQMAGALLWIAYGMIISASPVVVANVLVFAAAAWTAVRARRPDGLEAPRSLTIWRHVPDIVGWLLSRPPGSNRPSG